MTGTSQHEEMKRYLFQELSETEREALEGRFFEDNDYFYELMDLENNLIDRYVRSDLKGKELIGFERSLAKSPERREKIANARALERHIAEEKPVSIPVPTFRERISSLFNFQVPAFQFAMAAMTILLMVSTGVLLYKNFETRQELARLQTGRETEIAEKERAVYEQIKQSQEREQELRRQIESERGQTEAVGEQLETEQAQKAKLERELENLRQEKSRLPRENPNQINPPTPTIASAFLLPSLIERSGDGGEAKVIPISPNTKSVSFSLQVPKESTAETFSVRLNGADVAKNLKPRTTKSGNRILKVSLSAQKLGKTEHTLTVVGNDGNENSYPFRLQKR